VELRTVYLAGNALVIAIPPKMARALRIVKGTQLCVSLADRKLTLQRAIITGESTLAPDASNASNAND
jgi:antitoxin component of MazEF toxin-antitoxin module